MKLGAGATGGAAGGGGERLPQRSPSAEPSERLLASRAKPWWQEEEEEEGRGEGFFRGCPGGLTEDQKVKPGLSPPVRTAPVSLVRLDVGSG